MVKLRRLLGIGSLVWCAACSESATEVATVASVSVDRTHVLMTAIGDTVQLVASAIDDKSRAVATPVIWSSDAPAVIRVDSVGRVIGLEPGSARITADADGIRATVTVQLKQRVTRIEPEEYYAIMRRGDTLTAHFKAFDARGNRVANPQLTFTSSDSTWAAVDATGFVRADNIGNYSIRASVDGVSAARNISVVAVFDAIVAGGRISCALADTGEAYCAGAGFSDIVAILTASNSQTANPQRVRFAANAAEQQFVTLAVGTAHACGIAQSGRVYCWDGGAIAHAAPTTLAYTTISAHGDRTCGAATSGDVYCWLRTGAAQRVSGLPAVVAVSVGRTHACALTRDGEPWCWGANERAQLGIGSVDDSLRVVPQRVHTATRFRTITSGAAHTCAIAADGALYCWGANQFGQTGIGVFNSPCTVEGLPSDCVREPARVDVPVPVGEADAGDEHTCAVVVTQAYCWGNAGNGRLGNRVKGFTATPVAALYPNMRGLTAGSTFSCGYHPEVEGLSCWGSNEWGQLFYGWMGGESHEPGNVWFHRPRYLDP